MSCLRLIYILISLSLFCFSRVTFSSNLPPEHESARLLLYVETLVAEQQWAKADIQLSRLMGLDVQLPAVAEYFAGRIAIERGDENTAQSHLEAYVVKAGANSEYYKSALEMLTQIEIKTETTEQAPAKVEVGELKSESDSYLSSIKALFLTQDDRVALLQHVNSLLSAHVYTGSRVKLENDRTGYRYSIAASNGELVVTQTSFPNGKPLLTVDKVPVFGVDPFLEYSCSDSAYACWISHPSRETRKWLWIDRDPLVAAELTKALGKLLQVLQSNN